MYKAKARVNLGKSAVPILRRALNGNLNDNRTAFRNDTSLERKYEVQTRIMNASKIIKLIWQNRAPRTKVDKMKDEC